MDEKDFNDFLLQKLKEFSLMYGDEKTELTASGFVSTTSVTKAWSDLIVKTCASYLGCEKHYETKDEETFSIVCNFWKRYDNIITDGECWELSNLLVDKISELEDSGLINLNGDRIGEISSEIAFSLMTQIFSLKDDRGNVIDGFGISKPNIENIVESSITKMATSKYNTDFVFGHCLLICMTPAYRSSSDFSKLKAIIQCMRTKPDEEVKNSTYLATDSTGFVKIGRSSDFIEREQTLKIGNPTFNMLAVIGSDIETSLHKQYKSKNVTGEWFSLSIDDIRSILSSHKIVWKNDKFDELIKTISR